MNAITHLEKDTVFQDVSSYVDKKRKLWLCGLVVPNIANAAFLGYQFGPKKTKKLFAMVGTLTIHGIIPVLDKLLGEDPENPPEEAIAALEADPYYGHIVNMFIPLQYVANFYGNYLASRPTTPLVDQVLIGTLLGLVNGVGINTSHELCHKPGKVQHYLSHLCLAPIGYNHFRIEHPYGHHMRIATPEDPASSQMGETFWEFWPRTVKGGFKSAIQIEKRRLARKGKNFFSIHNELFHGWTMSASYHAMMLKIYGRRILPTQITQALYSITLFEAVNYLEHYGLLRPKLANGKYSRTMPEHSWNNNSKLSNILLYQLQRHSDHHAFPARSYQSLRHYEDVPQLPIGYAGLLLPVLIPKWWFKIMDERLIKHYDGDVEKINVYPKAKERLLKKYAHLFKSKDTV